MIQKKYLIFDYGASHGRCLVAKFDGQSFVMELVHDFDNRPVNYAGNLYWDILRLSSELDIGLQKAFRKYPDIVSVGVDTWGCDFGFIDKQGRLLANPVNYRDSWRHSHKDELYSEVSEYDVFRLGGANTNPIMGLYHMYALKREDATELKYADKLLMIPDLLNYYLTGIAKNEYTNATMTLMADQENHDWQYELIDRIGAPRHVFQELRQPGTILGNIRQSLCEEHGIPSVPVISVATHDTASAIGGIPLKTPDKPWAFISLGTWAIFGQETDSVNTSIEVFKSGFANQGGIEGKNNFVNLITGLWVIQQCRERWNRDEGRSVSWDEIVEAAKDAPAGFAFIDIQDEAFGPPNANMPGAVQEYCRKKGQKVPEGMGGVARAIYESMALKFMECMETIEKLAGKKPQVLHIFGGGVQNKLLCQWVADALQLEIFAGPTETTSVGNLLMQMKAMGDIKSLNEGRKISAQSSEVVTYYPGDGTQWQEYYKRYKEIKK